MERRGPRPSELLSELDQWDLRSVSSGSRSSVHSSHDGTPHISRAASSLTLTEVGAEGRHSAGSARLQQVVGRSPHHQQLSASAAAAGAGMVRLASGSLVATSSEAPDGAPVAGLVGVGASASGVSRSVSLQQIRASFFTSAPSLPPSIALLHDHDAAATPDSSLARHATRPASTSPDRAFLGNHTSSPFSLQDA